MSDDLTRLTDEEREWMTRPLPTGTSTRELSDEQAEAVVFRAAGLLAARTAALIDRAERAERERDELATAHEFMAQQFATMQREKEHGWREAEKWEAKADTAVSELAALRGAVTGLADERDTTVDGECLCSPYGGPGDPPCRCGSVLRALLMDEEDNG